MQDYRLVEGLQEPLDPQDVLQDSYIAVFSPKDGVPQAFQTLVLPFGARAAVMGFCRTSCAMWRIGVAIFGLHWTVYFDDYFLVAEVFESKHGRADFG